jgi:prepilin-type N-terminal cleavage/methylation domain-containing protein
MEVKNSGFTLIELLIVTVIIGVIVAIAIPKFSNTKEKSYLAAMKSDLRNVATAQESYYYDNGDYYNGAIPSVQLTYRQSSGVSVVLSNVTPGGWAAVASHTQTVKTCALFVGMAPVTAPAVDEGQLRCDQ